MTGLPPVTEMKTLLVTILLSFTLPAMAGWHKSAAVVKTVAESVTNSTTFQDDDELFGSFASGTTHQFHLTMDFTSASATPDAKFRFTESVVGSTIVARCQADDARAFSYVDEYYAFGQEEILTISAGETSHLVCDGVIFVHNGGLFKVQWAQNTADANATTMRKGSYWVSTAVTGF